MRGFVLAAAAAAVLMAGCSAAPAGGQRHPGAGGPTAFWSRSRLLGAAPMRAGRGHVPKPGQTANPHTAAQALRVGALFAHNAAGNHFCTASVVASPGKDVLITAAHCIHGGKGSGYGTDIAFIPDYRNGNAPFGVWTPKKLLVAPQWANSSDPDYDVGFVVLQPHNGQNIQKVLGANHLASDTGYRYLVRVTGYPDSVNAPIACRNWTSRQSATQLRFECGGFTGGTSGSPWVTRFEAHSRTGTIVGVIGGYQQGGNTPSVSYSAYVDSGIQQLYQQARSASVTRG
jgi:V8-like Glu-specific endopeptidase